MRGVGGRLDVSAAREFFVVGDIVGGLMGEVLALWVGLVVLLGTFERMVFLINAHVSK